MLPARYITLNYRHQLFLPVNNTKKLSSCLFNRTGSLQQVHANRWLCTDTNSDTQVYHGILSPQIRAVKVFSLATSIGGIVAQPILLEQANKIGGTPMIVAVCGIAGFFTFVTPFLLHLITKRYVIDLCYDVASKEYTATTISFLLQRQMTKFKLEDVVVPEIPGMFTTFMVGKKSLFVDPTLFPDPTHYIKIMGYDKPIDFKFEEARQSSEQDSKQ
ncbi:transmembrane protein 70 homolog, mitochondrial [Topomyia yanbarensis]|uniref:transmembrane protein 70 homolog, mitochondrial n=1 Tax=Topomyia yanbarensis TaxID=2498891 RepID=UPI00273AF734|nr:transmembrane protein 70 homolog, mitochondrial [Topomyia yanbarensis]